ncbi:hypothetical protein THASP1DRAFT_22443 [Thamnocephalis sphaerospora]|uniref:F-box domain-containing protein n=1 Tax=Thamnocephalis sphaerospora TaxID=78915 RepID=A0A4P9XVV3_9FUNG|nr:hypothetical protein THASP1DRAFT_22443 [Thamnocephalis sphaerospora]|eukprot:RKP09741.1 hypothetical protein THASP1DRAFT_22443 [Thamnocephalis sphaerospora]
MDAQSNRNTSSMPLKVPPLYSVHTIMKHIPDEVIDSIVAALDDELVLVALSRASKRLHRYVSSQQAWWRKRFMRDFPQHDESESRWFKQYKQRYNVMTCAIDTTSESSYPSADHRFSWFDAYYGSWHSDDYLVIRTRSKSDFCRQALYAWHFAALFKPPHTIISTRQWLLVTDLRANWLIGRHWVSAAAGHLEHRSSGCILRATATNMRMLWVHYSTLSCASVMAGYRLWQCAPDQPAPFHCQAAGTRKMISGSDVRPQRIDDNRIALWCDIKDKMVMWRKRCGVVVLLNLNNGSKVHRTTLDCWSNSGLYPVETLWKDMTRRTTWQEPQKGYIRRASSPTATLYSRGGVFIVTDYTGYRRQLGQDTPPLVTQLCSQVYRITTSVAVAALALLL